MKERVEWVKGLRCFLLKCPLCDPGVVFSVLVLAGAEGLCSASSSYPLIGASSALIHSDSLLSNALYASIASRKVSFWVTILEGSTTPLWT